MTSGLSARIAPDDAFVLDPKHLGIAAMGRDLEKLFSDFCRYNRESAWQFELSPEGTIIAMPPVNQPGRRSRQRFVSSVRSVGNRVRRSYSQFQRGVSDAQRRPSGARCLMDVP